MVGVGNASVSQFISFASPPSLHASTIYPKSFLPPKEKKHSENPIVLKLADWIDFI